MDFYYGVRHQIMSLLNVWDAVLDEKSRYDMEGMLTNSRPFLDASLLCLYIIPARLRVVPLGPFALQSPTARTSFPDLPAMVSDEEIPPAAWPGSGYSVAYGADGRPRTPYPRDEGYYSKGLALSDDEDGPDEAITISSNSKED
ncbi:hypothetical protein NKR23_g12339 [Pleurostoma richardsiae]|uniref:Uncharacterized protein n=1 Tax=Pleurostoma richardsiae TaxID=41990 RepID=A0AA38R2B1_9PEZI|nr:hypothetical protein NKR23_g12339 [Pleurostoma richardsiae]